MKRNNYNESGGKGNLCRTGEGRGGPLAWGEVGKRSENWAEEDWTDET